MAARFGAELVRFGVGGPETGPTGIRETGAGVLETGRRSKADGAALRALASRPRRAESPIVSFRLTKMDSKGV